MTPCGERKTLMFSATFPEPIQELARRFLNNYLFLVVGIVGGACGDIEQTFVQVAKKDKRNKLKEILTDMKSQGRLAGTLIFVRERRTVDYVASLMSESGFPTTSIHGERLQRERELAVNDFTVSIINTVKTFNYI